MMMPAQNTDDQISGRDIADMLKTHYTPVYKAQYKPVKINKDDMLSVLLMFSMMVLFSAPVIAVILIFGSK